MFLYSIRNKINQREFRGTIADTTQILKRRSYRHIKDLYEDICNPDNFYIKSNEFIDNYTELKKRKKEFISIDFLNDSLSYNKSMSHMKGKVVVKNSDGEISIVKIDHPDYISGKLISPIKNTKRENIHIRGKVLIKNQEGKNIFISVDDPRYISGELKNVNAEKDLTDKFPKLGKKIISSGMGNIKILDYCVHGNIQKKYKGFRENYLRENFDFCQECSQNKVLSIDDEKIELSKLKTLSGSQFNIKYIRENYPTIFFLTEKYSDISFKNKIFLLSNDMDIPPKCKYTKCHNDTYFLETHNRYSDFCHKHLNIGTSKSEDELYEWIKKIYNGIIHKNYKSKNNKEWDIYLPDIKIAIEYNGLYWHSELFKARKYHYDKWLDAKKQDIMLIQIWEDDWKYRENIVKSIILNRLGLATDKIFGRNCEIREIPVKEKNRFLDLNHMQGNCISVINLGIYHKNELVSLMSFGPKRYILGSKSINSDEYELLRFCNKINTSITGGASKLFHHFIRKYNPKKVISYANLDYSAGKLYEILKFDEESHSGLNYWWAKDRIKYHRSNFMKHKLVKNGADPSKTESEIMRELGYYKIWGSGNLKYLWNAKLQNYFIDI